MRQKALDFGASGTARTPPTRPRLSVSQLTEKLSGLVETEFFDLWVEGEVSNLTQASSGHCYFSLKDAQAQVRAVLFRNAARRLAFRLRDGLKVLARGGLRVYPPRGEYQLQVELLEPLGQGSLQQAFEELKERLGREGLFDAARKRPLPSLPRRLGVVTSPAGAVLRDMVRVLRRRNAHVDLVVYPARVQGPEAAAEIAQGIAALNRLGGIDVLLVARGGGSLEDLWPFNEERVARALAASRLPTLSAVGHETDVTIADFVADLRAPTPSAAIEMLVRAKDELQARIEALDKHLAAAAGLRLATARQALTALGAPRVLAAEQGRLRRLVLRVDEFVGRAERAFTARRERQRERVRWLEHQLESARLEHRLAEQRRRWAQATRRLQVFARAHTGPARTRLEALERRLTAAFGLALAPGRTRLTRLAAALDELSPLRVLGRGYALAFRADGRLLRRADEVALGESLRMRLHAGSLVAQVIAKENA